MLRREFLNQLVATAYVTSKFQREPAERPNIVFILADDLGYGDLGCYGQQRIRTPNLDRFASESARCTQAYAGSTVCAPSRCSLMTGKHTGHATVRGNMKPELGLTPSEATLPRLLQSAGYRTALFGKWGLGGPGNGSIPNREGFDEFYGFLDQQHAHNSFPESQWDNQNEVFLTQNWFGRRNVFVQDLYTQKAVSFIRSQQDRPFFLYLAYTSPHADNERGQIEPNGIDVPTTSPYEAEPWPEVEKSFAALVTRLDRDAGTVLRTLTETRLEHNTIVIFTSDNGPHHEGNHDPEFFRSRGPLRGIKRDLYEGGIRIPFIIRWPGRIQPGPLEQPFAFWDMLPTLCDSAGVSIPEGLDGISVLPTLSARKRLEHPPFYWEFHEKGFAQAIRHGSWKAVKNAGQTGIELYDLGSDIGEKHDLAGQKSEVAAQLARMMETSRTASPFFPSRR